MRGATLLLAILLLAILQSGTGLDTSVPGSTCDEVDSQLYGFQCDWEPQKIGEAIYEKHGSRFVYRAACSHLSDPHELCSCGESDGQLPRCLLTPLRPPTSSARAVNQMDSYRLPPHTSQTPTSSARAVNRMDSYRAACSHLSDPHELCSCGESDGQLPKSSPRGVARRAGHDTAGNRVLRSEQPCASSATGTRVEHGLLRRYVRRVLDAGGQESCGGAVADHLVHRTSGARGGVGEVSERRGS